jgi:RNA ligase (TIGR02306 family)
MRKLASIQKITRLAPIEGATAIEVADVLGWHVVVQKNEFNVGDLVVYCEVDSILPDKPEFEFLRNVKFRIKTIRLRGQVSQGICFPMTILPLGTYCEDDDVTEILGVQLYEPPETGGYVAGASIGSFPSHIVSKTDEDRVQNKRQLLTNEKGRKCYITEKLDGSSATYIVNSGESIMASRNMKLFIGNEPLDEAEALRQIARAEEFNYETSIVKTVNDDGTIVYTKRESIYNEMNRKYGIFDKLTSLGMDIAIQGEIIGPGIQQNKYKLKERELRVFNVIETTTRQHFTIKELVDFCADHGFQYVPILDTVYELSDNSDEIVEMSKGKSVLHDVIREGIVVRPVDGERFSFKALNPDFLLKYE